MSANESREKHRVRRVRNLAAKDNQSKPKRHTPKTAYKRNKSAPLDY